MTALVVTLAVGLVVVCLLWLVESVGRSQQLDDLRAENADLRAEVARLSGHPAGRRLRVVRGAR